VGGISDVLCVCVCLHTHTHTHTHIHSGACPGDLAFFRPTRTKIGVRLCVFVFVCLCAHKNTQTHKHKNTSTRGLVLGTWHFFRPTHTEIGVRCVCVCVFLCAHKNTQTHKHKNTSTRGLVLGTWHFFRPTHTEIGVRCVCVCLCFCVCFVFFSQVRPSRVFWPYSDYGQPAPIQSFRRVAEFFAAGLAYQTPYLASTGPLACFFFWVLLLTYPPPARPPALFNNSAAELRNFVLLVFLPYQTPYLAEYGPSRVPGFANICRQNSAAAAKWWPLASCFGPTHGPPYSIIPQSCGICQGGRLLSNPYLAEYGQYTWEGFNVKKQNKTK
jgi:hypothetical protein